MERDDISELHFICPIPNIVSVLEHGILSHSKAGPLQPVSVANQDVQNLRSDVKVPNGRDLHDYANLYFNGRNPMMYRITKTHGVDRICLLRVDVAMLDLPGTVITDCNAASNYVRFSEPTTGLSRIDKDELFSTYWTHPDQAQEQRHKSRMCAEVLVPDRVEPSKIIGAYVGSDAAFASLAIAAPSLNVTVDTAKFFA